ncbi:glutathione binding-like protein [Plesiomonas shigelloides]|nr:glutathione binding-like protein [Plesiomonas shigelloides]MCX2534929.1 glutathione binding-like protein [Plesiomonas shigelloides]
MSSRQALSLMEQQLTRTPYLAGEDYSLADISLSAYTHVAEEGGI